MGVCQELMATLSRVNRRIVILVPFAILNVSSSDPKSSARG